MAVAHQIRACKGEKTGMAFHAIDENKQQVWPVPPNVSGVPDISDEPQVSVSGVTLSSLHEQVRGRLQQQQGIWDGRAKDSIARKPNQHK